MDSAEYGMDIRLVNNLILTVAIFKILRDLKLIIINYRLNILKFYGSSDCYDYALYLLFLPELCRHPTERIMTIAGIVVVVILIFDNNANDNLPEGSRIDQAGSERDYQNQQRAVG